MGTAAPPQGGGGGCTTQEEKAAAVSHLFSGLTRAAKSPNRNNDKPERRAPKGKSVMDDTPPVARTTFTETPLFEVCSAKKGFCHFVRHQHFPKRAKHNLRGPLHSALNIECIVTAIRRPRDGSHSEYSVQIPSLRLRNHPDVRCACLDRQPFCSVTTTASDDDFSMPANTPEWSRGSHFPSLAGLAGMYKISSPNSKIGCLFAQTVSAAVSFRRCRCRTRSSGTQRVPPASTVSGTLVPMRCSSAAFSNLA